MRRSALAVVLAGATACSLTTNLDGFTGGTPKPDGGGVTATPEGGNPEASTLAPPNFVDGGDASVAPPASGGGVIIATNTSTWAAGGAQKHHLYYAQNIGAWVLFYESASQRDRILIKATTDLVTFVDASPIMLPEAHDNDGRNFDVAYANIGGADIFYVAYSTHTDQRYSYVLRGRAQGNAVTWGTPLAMGAIDQTILSDPDAPAVAVQPTGQVFFSSGFNDVNGHYGNFVGFASTSPDDGTAGFIPTFDSGTELEVANQSVNARMLLVAAGGALGVWERGDNEPNPKDLAFAIFQNGAWGASDTAGFAQVSYNVNDWDATLTESDGRSHIVRWANGAYEHRYYDFQGGHPGFAVQAPPSLHSAGDGLLLLDIAGVATMFELGIDHVVRGTNIQSSSTWAPWKSLTAADPTRKHLAGGSNAGTGILLWEIVNADGTSDLAAMKLQ